MRPGLTVVIPAYRAANTIMRTINSVDSAVMKPEIIVVEDGVYDDLQAMLSNHTGHKLLSKVVNSGAASARNYGLDAVQTKYVFFLDSDDYVGESLFDELHQALERSGADIAFGPWCFVYDNKPSKFIRVPKLKSNDAFIARWLQSECFPPCCVMWRTESIRKIGGWNESFRHNDDAELVIRALISGFEMAVTEEGIGYYVQHDSPDRVSRAEINVSSEAADRIFEMVKVRFENSGNELLRIAMADFSYEQARRCYRAGDSALGHKWHERSKQQGLSKHIGSRAHVITARLLGLRRKEKLASMRDSIPLLGHLLRHRFE